MPEMGLAGCHSESFAVILIPPCGRRISLCPLRINCAKNLALSFSVDNQQSEMPRGVYPDPAAAGERAQHHSGWGLSGTVRGPTRAAAEGQPDSTLEYSRRLRASLTNALPASVM
jgi:hypothetical protein